MPAAAVIPAPIAYAKIVAVKKLVVGFLAKEAVVPACQGLRILVRVRRSMPLCHHSWRVHWLLIELVHNPDQLL